MTDPGSKALKAQLSRTTAGDLAALDQYGAMLDRLKPTGSFVLGRQTMQGLLSAEMVSLPVEQVVAAGRAQLARDRAAFLATEAEIDKANPSDSLALVRHDHSTTEGLLGAGLVPIPVIRRELTGHDAPTL